jgi:hypothetical protein
MNDEASKQAMLRIAADYDEPHVRPASGAATTMMRSPCPDAKRLHGIVEDVIRLEPGTMSSQIGEPPARVDKPGRQSARAGLGPAASRSIARPPEAISACLAHTNKSLA